MAPNPLVQGCAAHTGDEARDRGLPRGQRGVPGPQPPHVPVEQRRGRGGQSLVGRVVWCRAAGGRDHIRHHDSGKKNTTPGKLSGKAADADGGDNFYGAATLGVAPRRTRENTPQTCLKKNSKTQNIVPICCRHRARTFLIRNDPKSMGFIFLGQKRGAGESKKRSFWSRLAAPPSWKPPPPGFSWVG